MKAVVLLNEKSGACVAGATPITPKTIGDAFLAAGVDAEVRCVPGEDFAVEAHSAAEVADTVVAGGGDGTISAVAGALAGGDTPLGVLAVGTLNHFAKDLKIPLELGAAAKVIAARHVQKIDVGTVNGRVFINNSSLGVYARALMERDAARTQWGWGKWPAMALAAARMFWRSPLVRVRLDTAEDSRRRRTPLVFVGNNRYRLDLFNVGARHRLDDGELSLYVANTATRWGILKLALRAAIGRLEQSRDFETTYTPHVWIESRRKHRDIAVDGEVIEMAPPLHYRVWPRALPVITPEAP
jgi:diacylglycerol kinase family enzyme